MHGGSPGQGVTTEDCAPVPYSNWHDTRLAVTDTGLEGSGSAPGGLSLHLRVVLTIGEGAGQFTFSRGDVSLVDGNGAVHRTQTVDGACRECLPRLLQPGESSSSMDVCPRRQHAAG